jgi:hypothetical protein
MDLNTRKKALRLLAEERCDAVPALAEFKESVTKELTRSADSFWRCDEAFRSLCKSDYLTSFTNHELGKFLRDPIYVPLMSFSSQVVLIETDHFQLNIGFINKRTARPTGRVQSLASHCMLAVDASPLRIMEYVQPKPFPSDTFRREDKLVEVGVRTLQPGAVTHIRAGYDVLDFIPEEGATSVVTSFSDTNRIDYSWEYSSDTLSPVRFAPGDSTWSRTDYAIQIISAMSDSSYLPTLEKLAQHPAHFVRWQAICAVVKFDFDAGKRLLEIAREDPHSHVRNAARRTLESYSAALAAAV